MISVQPLAASKELDNVGPKVENVVVYNVKDICDHLCSLQDTVVARVDHQQHHLRRLKIQRSEESDSLSPLVRGQQQLLADNGNGLPNSPWDFSKPLSLKDKRDHQTSHGMIWSWVRA